jgi:hypothetical protein
LHHRHPTRSPSNAALRCPSACMIPIAAALPFNDSW